MGRGRIKKQHEGQRRGSLRGFVLRKIGGGLFPNQYVLLPSKNKEGETEYRENARYVRLNIYESGYKVIVDIYGRTREGTNKLFQQMARAMPSSINIGGREFKFEYQEVPKLEYNPEHEQKNKSVSKPKPQLAKSKSDSPLRGLSRPKYMGSSHKELSDKF